MMASPTPRRVVCVTFGSPGDVQPFLAIGRALNELGHQAVVATSELYRKQVIDAGLEFVPSRPNRCASQQDPDFVDRVLRDRNSPADVFRQMFLPSLRDSVYDLLQATEGADAVVTHPLASGGRLAAEARGLPWISVVLQPMGYLSAHEPPVVGAPLLSAALRRLGPGTTRRIHGVARMLTDYWAREWHDIRSELDLPAVVEHPLWDGQHSRTRSLGLFPRSLGEPQPDWPTQVRVTGFPFYRPPERALTPELQRFLEDGEPPVVFTLGTTAVNDPGPFYEESAAAVTQLGLRAVLVAGPANNIDRLNSWTSDILAVPYAPHHLLFPRARAIVHQGGIGTLSEALLARKPMVIMPYGHDQADNAWRAERLGVAQIIPRRRYRRHVVRRALERLMLDDAKAMAVNRIGQIVEQERGAETAARSIAATVLME